MATPSTEGAAARTPGVTVAALVAVAVLVAVPLLASGNASAVHLSRQGRTPVLKRTGTS